MVSGRLVFEKYISIVFWKKWPLFDLQIQYVRRLLRIHEYSEFLNIYCYY